jgi:hypothetical protein
MEARQKHIRMSAGAHAAAAARRFRDALAPGFTEMVRTPFYWIIAGMFSAYCLAAVLLLAQKGVSVDPLQFARIAFKPAAILVFVLLYLGWPKSVKDRFAGWFNARNAVAGVTLIVMFEVFFSIFMTFKMFYPSFVPFHADAWLSEVDRKLHFGELPWQWLSPALGNWLAILVIDFLYTGWLLVKFIVLIWQAFSLKKPGTRAIFFLTYFMTWILLGTVIALAFSSGGPCYYDVIQSPLLNPYHDQMAFLKSIHRMHALGAVSFQEVLWANHVEGNRSLVAGISAFPSIHVAVSLIFVLVARAYSRRLTIIFFLYFLAILAGSVALGWHYAADGYFSIVAVLLLWAGNAWLVRRYALWKPRG